MGSDEAQQAADNRSSPASGAYKTASSPGEVLLRRLELRFGALPPNVVDTVLSATPEELDAWAGRLLRVSSLRRLFEAA